MATSYVTKKTAQVYKQAGLGPRETVLIFGDEVEILGSASNGWAHVGFRDKDGYISRKDIGDTSTLEMYFIDVGQGDATFVVTPKRKKILIDGGIDKRAFGFLAWKYRLDKPGPIVDIDLLVLSHADADHIDGLAPIIEHPRIRVHKAIHNGIATYDDPALKTTLGNLDATKKFLVTRHDGIGDLAGASLSKSYDGWLKAIVDEKAAYNAVHSATPSIDIGDPTVRIDVLGPRLMSCGGLPAYRWLGGEAPTINGHSVLLRLSYDHVSVLLAGDINEDGADNVMLDGSVASRLPCHVFKAPHHGSHDFSRSFLQAIRPQVSVISSGDDPDHGHPRAVFIAAVGQASRSSQPLVFSTEIAATFVEAGASKKSVPDGDLRNLDPTKPDSNKQARLLFKKVLNGMINVRTDGKDLYAARRVNASYMWESYGPLKAVP